MVGLFNVDEIVDQHWEIQGAKHAYEVGIWSRAEAIAVLVEDHGYGIADANTILDSDASR